MAADSSPDARPSREPVELVWPPPDTDVDAIQIIDLGEVDVAMAARAPEPEQAVAVTPKSALLTPLPLRASDRDRTIALAERSSYPRRRVRLWVLGLGLALLQLSEFRAGQRSGRMDTSGRDILPVPSMLAAPAPQVDSTRASSAHVSPQSGGALGARPTRTPSVRRRAGSGRVARSHRPPIDVRDEELAPKYTVLPNGRTVVDLSPAAGFVPPRVIVDSRPRLVPAPFPSPRGARTRLELAIDETGRVTSARVAVSGASHYDQPLLGAARTWRFEPARLEGKPMKSVYTMDVPIPR